MLQHGRIACALPGAAQGQRLRLQEEHQALQHKVDPVGAQVSRCSSGQP